MDRGTIRGLLVALLIAAVGLTACVVRTAPTRHRHERAEPHQKHKQEKHKKHKKHKDEH